MTYLLYSWDDQYYNNIINFIVIFSSLFCLLAEDKINELLPLHNVQYEKNTDLLGRPIRKKYGFRLYNTGKIMYGHMS